MRTIILFLTIISIGLYSCDKNGNLLPSSNKLEIQKDGITYGDARHIILTPGAPNSPFLTYNPPPTDSYQQYKENFTLSASPYTKGENPKGFDITIYCPVNGGVVLNKKYEIKPNPGKERIQIEKGNRYFEDWDNAFIRYSDNDKIYYYGTGYIMFTHFDDGGNPSNAKGSGIIEFTIPNENGGRTSLKGTFTL
ncbi:hypothetical protein [Sphingobacterium sp. UBA1498]|uniref:hypothetical protein n=1 Tax=Sphingobacterium sp. UBA1498 TaxID=1947481 RepID=UPI0025D15925|nr:hypothetical protein [Sphingobacterium sp. UBA1498]